MQKERLTKERIQEELLELKKQETKNSVYLLIYGLIFAAITLIFLKASIIIPIVLSILTVTVIGLSIYYFIKNLKSIKTIKENGFKIEKDELVEATAGYTVKQLMRKSIQIPYKLKFFSGAEFHMQKGARYPIYCYHKWSKLYNLDCMGEFNHAHKGDIYYTVSLTNPKKPDVIFNSRIFELDDINNKTQKEQ